MVLSIDRALSSDHDLRDEEKVQRLVVLARSGRFASVHAGPPCGTWSRARYRELPGPPPLRSRALPWGLPGLTARLTSQLRSGTELFWATMLILGAVLESLGLYSLEHPEDPGEEPYPSIWDLDCVEELRLKGLAVLETLNALLDQRDTWPCTRASGDLCEMGADTPKPTTLQGNLEALAEFDGRRCSHGLRHPSLGGRTRGGAFRTAAAARYPSDFSRWLALVHLRGIFKYKLKEAEVELSEDDEVSLRQEIFKTARQDEARRLQPLAAGTCWDPKGRWRELLRCRWTREEHQNVLELRVAVLGLRRLLLEPRRWDSRQLILTDSLVAVGSLLKGRSSSPALLARLRAAAATLLATGVLVYARWVEGWRNHADGPSRGQAIGQAVKALERRIRWGRPVAAPSD